MCGIAGNFINKVNSSENIVGRILNLIEHRGPDDHGIFTLENFGSMGMRRLSIQDLTDNGHQPMYSSDSSVILVYNGEIYNSNKKRLELEKDGFVFKSQSDTEVLLNLYLKYNEDCLEHIEGMFAFAIIDKRYKTPKLLLARDHFGIKPLYYSLNNFGLTFCSELTPFYKTEIIEKKLNIKGLRQLLNFGSISQPNTIFEDVQMLLPGHKLVLKNGNAEIFQFWNVQVGLNKFRSKFDKITDPVETIEGSLIASVNEQLCGDVQIGLFLSGGIDSSLIAAIANKESKQKLNTFSLGFNSKSDITSELTRSKKIANYIGTNHNEVLIDEKFVVNSIDDFICSIDQPTVDGLNTFLISQTVSKQYKVALSGTGGDELFAGYPWFRKMADFKHNSIGNWILDRINLRDSYLENKLELLSNGRSFLDRFSTLHQCFSKSEVNNIIKIERKDFFQNYFDERYDVLKDEISSINRTTGLVMNSYLLNQLLRDIDACSMYNTLEVRVPFLSLNVLYNALAINDEFKLGDKDLKAPFGSYRYNGEKKVLFEIANKYLPSNFDCVPKSGFTLPFDDWLHGDLKDVVNETLDYLSIEYSEYFHSNELLKVKKMYYKGGAPWYKIWILLILGKWLKNLDSSQCPK